MVWFAQVYKWWSILKIVNFSVGIFVMNDNVNHDPNATSQKSPGEFLQDLQPTVLRDIKSQVDKGIKVSLVQKWAPPQSANYLQNIQGGISKKSVLGNIINLSNDLSIALDSEDSIFNAFVAIICACIKYSSRQSLFESVVKDNTFVDWDIVHERWVLLET